MNDLRVNLHTMVIFTNENSTLSWIKNEDYTKVWVYGM